MAKKRATPEIRFKGNSDEWEETIIGNIGSFYYGRSAPKWSLEDDAQTLCIRYGELYTKFGATITKVFSRTNINPQKLRFSKGGEILIPRVGEKPEDFGKCCCFLTLGNIAIGEMISVFETSENPLFYTYYFRTMYLSFAKVVEGKNVKNLYYIELEPLPVYRPTLLEQSQVGTFFQSLDFLISLRQKKLDKLTQVKKSMLEKMFPKDDADVPEIRFKGFTDKWERKKLGEIINYIVDNRGKNPEYYCNDGIPVIDNFMIKNNIYPNLNEATRFIDEYLFNNFIRKYNEFDDILITLVGNGIGNITLFPKSKSVIIQNTLGLRFSNNKKFMFYALLSNNQKIVILDRGMAQPSIRQDELLDIDIKIPNDKEQTKIGAFFQNLDKLISLQQRELDKLKNIKKSCLEKMFV